MLDARLEDALYVGQDELPNSVVSMGSTVELIDLRTQERRRLTLVHPDDEEFFDDAVSVLDPLGLALLGSSIGSVLQCRKGRATARYLVEGIIRRPPR